MVTNYWGTETEKREDKLTRATQQLQKIPKLIPSYSHRYIPLNYQRNN
jgi:hypothetical protein